jgi:5-methyltetrahydrofolate--homocysteine methyltransferase
MKTVLRGKSTEVIIDTDGPVRIIGECINPTRRKKLVSSLQAHNFDFVTELAHIQINHKADILDVNVGYPGVDDEKLLPETVIYLQESFDIPLCIDTPNPKAIEAALKVARGKCLINSVNGEEKSLAAILPLVKEYGAAVIGLVMDDDGITHDPGKRLSIAEKIVTRAVQKGIKEEDVIIDSLAMAVSADPSACMVTLNTIRLVHEKLGLNITMGASNISFGLPGRESLNSAFISLAIYFGLTCPIANPEKIVSAVRAIELVMGRDDYAMRLIEYFQGLEQNK